MIRIALTFAFVLFGAPAFALSCLPHDFATTFNQAKEAKETYIIVHGALQFDETALPEVDWNNQQDTPPNTLIPAQITGKFLSLNGFSAPFDKEISLNIQCLGPWCAKAKSGAYYLTFLRETPQGHSLTLSPCGGFGFANPTQKTLTKATQCIRGDTCLPKN